MASFFGTILRLLTGSDAREVHPRGTLITADNEQETEHVDTVAGSEFLDDELQPGD